MMRKNLLVTLVILFAAAGSLFHQAAMAQEVTLGIAWEGKSSTQNRYVAGLQKIFQEKAPQIDIEVQGEQESFDQLAAVVERFQREKDGMLILRSSGAKWLGEHPPTIPAFIGAANHPKYLGAVRNIDAPEGNITGVSYFVPVKQQFDVFQALVPTMSSLWLLLEAGHPSSAIDREETRTYAEAHGIEYHDTLAVDRAGVLAAVKDAVKADVSIIIIGNPALGKDIADQIVDAAGDIPVFSYQSTPVQHGALGEFAANEDTLIGLLAESIIDVLVNGKAVQDVPIKFDPNPQFSLNETTAKRLQINVPYNILKYATIVQ